MGGCHSHHGKGQLLCMPRGWGGGRNKSLWSVVNHGLFNLSIPPSTPDPPASSPCAPRSPPRSGNTALHLCVHHDQMDMYEHLVEYCGALEHVRNNRGMTPLLLAASLGKLEVGWVGDGAGNGHGGEAKHGPGVVM